MSDAEAIVLELAPLPREQTGPFLILGVDKDADAEQVEAQWARRVIWARKGQIAVPLQDINWAREVLNDAERRVRADVASLNTDTLDQALREVARRFGVGETTEPAWEPRDVEKPLEDYTPAAEVPDVPALLSSIVPPEPAFGIPPALKLLEEFAREPIDPWQIRLPE
jgi:hypothetical protein